MQQWNDPALMLLLSSVCRAEKTAPGDSAKHGKAQQLSSKTIKPQMFPSVFLSAKTQTFSSFQSLFKKLWRLLHPHINCGVILMRFINHYFPSACSRMFHCEKKKVKNKGEGWNSGPAVIFRLCCQCEKFRNRMWPTVAPQHNTKALCLATQRCSSCTA